ncbi:MAG: hypothetical protein ACXW3T_04235 [Rhodoplanes sp.]
MASEIFRREAVEQLRRRVVGFGGIGDGGQDVLGRRRFRRCAGRARRESALCLRHLRRGRGDRGLPRRRLRQRRQSQDWLVRIVAARQQPRRGRHRHFGAFGEKCGVERLTQRDGVARDEHPIDIRPIAPGQVLKHRPALQARLGALLRQHETIGRLPHRRGDDVADGNVARPLAEKSDRKRPPLLGAVLGESGERPLDLRLRPRIAEAERGDLFQHRLHEPLVRHQSEAVARGRAAIVGQRHVFVLHVEDAALRRHLARDLDLAADQRVEQRRP